MLYSASIRHSPSSDQFVSLLFWSICLFSSRLFSCCTLLTFPSASSISFLSCPDLLFTIPFFTLLLPFPLPVLHWSSRYDIIWYDVIYYDMLWYDMLRYPVWYDMTCYDILYDMIWHVTISCMIWSDMIWYDFIRFDIFWSNMAHSFLT